MMSGLVMSFQTVSDLVEASFLSITLAISGEIRVLSFIKIVYFFSICFQSVFNLGTCCQTKNCPGFFFS